MSPERDEISQPMPTILKISGPTVVVGPIDQLFMGEMVQVGDVGLIGEVIRIENKTALVQVYEETEGLTVGEPVLLTGESLNVELGPGLLGSVFDGVQRPLKRLYEKWGDFISRGAIVYRLDREKEWEFRPTVRVGDFVSEGEVVGTVLETETINHKVMVPVGVKGNVETVATGLVKITDCVAELTDGQKITLRGKWPVRRARPKGKRIPLNAPLLTGQRVIDTLFPIAEGGAAIIPGGFGSGKTVLEQTIAKYAASDVIVYVGCGERGNEMADTLSELGALIDPVTGRPLMERTVLIANTSNMPVAAREASIYTGVTIAEYYRDMGLAVTLLADSTSRWAEALREISSRLEEIPGEEGYPAYLGSRLGAFYERAGKVEVLGRKNETGSVTIIGAVSPPGADFSEPVTQASLRMASTFWGLDASLAHQRHFPAIDWSISYSLTLKEMGKWYADNVSGNWAQMVATISELLQEEEALREIVSIVGADSLDEKERVTLEAARIVREGFLRQSAVHPVDAYCRIEKQKNILETILNYIEAMRSAVAISGEVEEIISSPLTESLLRIKETPDDQFESELDSFRKKMADYFSKAVKK